jgi:hypothetical protein
MDMDPRGVLHRHRSFRLSAGMRGQIEVYVGAPPAGEPGRRVWPEELASDLRASVLAGSGVNYYALVGLCEELGWRVPRPPQHADLLQMANDLVEAFDRERLVALERITPHVEMLAPPETERTPVSEPVPPTTREEPPVTTWIELWLVDEDGMPVPNRRFSLVLPDERVLEGAFDEYGHVYIRGIDPGMCRLTFPDLDVSTFA